MDTDNLTDGKKEYIQDEDFSPSKPEYFLLFVGKRYNKDKQKKNLKNCEVMHIQVTKNYSKDYMQ